MTMREAQARRKQPAFMDTAETFYGSAFGPTNPKQLARSIADWSEMTPEEQTFALGHLQWLQLQAQAEVCHRLVRVCRLLEEVVEAVDEIGGAGDDPDPGDADADTLAVDTAQEPDGAAAEEGAA